MQQAALRSSRPRTGRSPVPILHVRNVPAALYAGLRRRAAANHRSLSAEVLAVLERAEEEAERGERHRAALERLDRLRRRARGRATDATAWIRELRDRG